MLEVSNHEITFVYSDSALMQASINIRNLSGSSYVTYKVERQPIQIKTTTPDLFEVNPSKGVLQPSQSKMIEFKLNKVLSRADARILSMKEKFLIQALMLQDKKKPQEIEQLWSTYRNDASKIENIKLKLKIEGIEATDQTRSMNGPSAGMSPPQQLIQASTSQPPDLFPAVRSAKTVPPSQFASIVSNQSPPVLSQMRNSGVGETRYQPPQTTSAFMSVQSMNQVTPQPRLSIPAMNEEEGYAKLEELKRQEVHTYVRQEQLEVERDEVFRGANKNNYQTTKSTSLLPSKDLTDLEILMFAFLFVIGIALSRYIFRKHPSPEHIIQPQHGEVVREIVRDQRLNPHQKIILSSDDSSQVILTNDDTQPIRLSVRTAQMPDGTKKLIIT